MMNFSEQISAVESIKPAAPTPQNLRTHRLSWIDQITVQTCFPFIFFYPSAAAADIAVDEMTSSRIAALKRSLSEALAVFYPLAGRLVATPDGVAVVDCTDDGADFFESRVSEELRLSEFLDHVRRRDAAPLDLLLPPWRDLSAPLSVKATVFPCGGMAVAVAVAHKLVDGFSLCSFVAAWSEFSRSGSGAVVVVPPPSFDAAEFFPPSPAAAAGAPPVGPGTQQNQLVPRRFVFDTSKVAKLRAISPEEERPTRVEAVLALIWRCCLRARRSADAPVTSIAKVLCNIRGRGEPPLPDSLFGNVVIITAAGGTSVMRLEKKLRKGIRRAFDTEHIGRIQGPDGHEFDLARDEEETAVAAAEACGGGLVHYRFTSWARFPVYEVDFGWGRPSWVTAHYLLKKNFALLMPISGSGGLEAWVTLEAEEMARFERDDELLSFADSPMSPLQLAAI